MVVMINEQSWPVSLDYTYEHLRLGRKRRGVPQRTKHQSPVTLVGKKCSQCKQVKPTSEFFASRNVRGLQYLCKECERANKRAWYARNNDTVQRRKDIQRERSREYKRRKFGYKAKEGAA